jgi:hypothetical protein
VETPDAPRGGNAARLGKFAEAYGLAGTRWIGRGDEERGLTLLALLLGAAYFVVLFLPWIGGFGRTESGWTIGVHDSGLVALALVLVESLRLSGVWGSRGSKLLDFCLLAATGVLGIESLVTLRWGGPEIGGFAPFEYGAWLGLVIAILLILVAALRLATLWRSAP